MKSAVISALIGAALFVQSAVAHPGDSAAEKAAENAKRNAYFKDNARSLSHCAEKLKARGNDEALQARRAAIVEDLRKKRSISNEKPHLRIRDGKEVLATSHHSNRTDITPGMDPTLLFTGNGTCLLTPEVTEGPYWVQGELVRTDVTDGQEAVKLTLDIQVIDTKTCEPVPETYIEIWACNSTGVYSGVTAQGNGNTADTTNLNSTAFRGVQATGDLGVVTFDTAVPGHYIGRTNHIHVMSHLNATLLPNNTIAGGAVTHVGQMFFDQDLLALVEQVEPYASNTQQITTNEQDFIFMQEAEGYDPMVEYVLLGDDVSQGLFGWVTFGIDSTYTRNVSAAASWTDKGGVANPNPGMGGPPPGGFPSGFPGFPSGSFPSGFPGFPTGGFPVPTASSASGPRTTST